MYICAHSYLGTESGTSPLRLIIRSTGSSRKNEERAAENRFLERCPQLWVLGDVTPFNRSLLGGLFYSMLEKETSGDHVGFQYGNLLVRKGQVYRRQATDGVYLTQQKQKPNFGLPNTTQKPTPTYITERKTKRVLWFG